MIPDILTNKSTTKSGKQVTHLAGWVTFLLSMALALGTWNPTGHHFIHYLSSVDDILSGFKPFAILIMIALWLLALKSIFQSLGYFGLSVLVIIIGAFVWGLQEYNIVNIEDLDQLGWTATLSIGFIIWFGLNASIFWKKLTGVYTTDATSEDL